MKLLLAAALLVASLPARAQEDSSSPSSEQPSPELPGSDSPESTAAVRVVRPQWQGGRKRIQTFLVPLDESARKPTARVAQALEAFQGSLSQYEVVDLGKALKVDSTPAEAEHATEGRKLVAEGNLLFAGRGYADAAEKYKAAIKSFDKGLAAIDAHEYAEAWARLGAVEALAGDDKAARAAFLNAARHDPEAKIQGRAIDASAELRMQAGRADVEALASGTLEIEAKPVGARIVIDGEQKGQTPARYELSAGKHLVRVERAGYFPSAALVEVPGGKESQHSVALRSTPRAANLYEVMAGAAEEAGRGEVGAQTAQLGEKFALERMYIGSLASHGRKVALTLALVDLGRHKQVGKVEALLQSDGTDADQLEDETRAAAKKLALADPGDAVAPGDASAKVEPMAHPDINGKEVRQPDQSAHEPSRALAVPADEATMADKERKPQPPAETAKADAPAEQPKKKDDGKRKKRKLKDVTGTEGWDE